MGFARSYLRIFGGMSRHFGFVYLLVPPAGSPQ